MGIESSFIAASAATLTKIEEEHDVSFDEIEEAFYNSTEPYPVDKRPQHKTIPPTQYFISHTFSDRFLKVVFIWKREEGKVELKSAYDPEPLDFIKYIEAGGKLPWL